MAQKPCKQCRTSNARSAIYCARCGSKFDDGTKPDKPTPGFPKECPRCFATLTWYASFCYKCGVRQPEADDIEPYEDPDTARLYSWLFFRRMRWVSLTIAVAGIAGGILIWNGGVEPVKSSALLFSLGMGILSLESLIYAFSVHVNVRMKPSSERMYDLYREISPALRLLRPAFKDLQDRISWASGKISGQEYERRAKEAEGERESLKAQIKALENELKISKSNVKVIKPTKGE